MRINQIISGKQMAMIGYNNYSYSVYIGKCRRQLDITSRLLRAYPYPYHPYDPPAGRLTKKAGRRPRVAVTLSLQTGAR